MTYSLDNHLQTRREVTSRCRLSTHHSSILPVVEEQTKEFNIPGVSWLEQGFNGIGHFLEALEEIHDIPKEAKVAWEHNPEKDVLSVRYLWWDVSFASAP